MEGVATYAQRSRGRRRFCRSDSGGKNVAKPKRPIGSAAHYAVLYAVAPPLLFKIHFKYNQAKHDVELVSEIILLFY